jgi:hypothetical protein
MTQITIPALVVNGHLQHEKSLADLEGQHVLATLTVVPKGEQPIDLEKWRRKIESMKTLVDGWDSYRAPAPSAESITRATLFLEEAAKSDNVLSRLAPSVIGGVGFTFKHANRKVYVEFRNTGSVHALLSDNVSEPVVENVQPNQSAYADLVPRIKGYLHE